MGKAYRKDIWRSIVRSKRRFISILAITALGVMVLTGIYATCQDMYYSADQYYDNQNLFDIRILSTLGLTDEDVDELSQVSGIVMAEGAYSETVHTYIGELKHTAEMTMLSTKGMNMPYVEEGTLPTKPNEIAVTQKYLEESGKTIGDTLTIEEELDNEEEDDEGGDVEDEEVIETTTTEEETSDNQTDSDNETNLDNETDSDSDLDTDVDWDAEVEIEEEEDTPTFKNTTYTITALVSDPMDINNNSAMFRSATNAADYTFFVSKDNIDSDIYTCVYVTLEGMKELNCYTPQYEDAVKEIINYIEIEIKEQREEARYEEIRSEALDKIHDAESIMSDKFQEADEKFSDAWEEVEEGRLELKDGEEELSEEEKDAWQKLEDARIELADAEQELLDGDKELQQGEKDLAWAKMELNYNEWKLSEGRKELERAKRKAMEEFALAEKELAEQQAELDSSRVPLEAGIGQLKMLFGFGWPEEAWNNLVDASANKTAELLHANPDGTPDPNVIAGATAGEQYALSEEIMKLGGVSDNIIIDYTPLIPDCVQAGIGLGIVNGGQQVLSEGKATYETIKADALKKFADAEAELRYGEEKLKEGWEQLEEGELELEDAKLELADGWKEWNEGKEEFEEEEAKAKKEIADAWDEIEDGKKELAEGEQELVENQDKYFDKKEEAKNKVSDAYEELGDLDMTEWYVQDRTNLSSYSGLKNDMSSIESIGTVFPIVFLVVAILISLTTMTRMVEDERGLIGTYKALGFGNGSIYFKYLMYAVFACILGGILGDICGFIILPKFLLYILETLYVLPQVSLHFDVLYGLGGAALFMVGIVGATIYVCRIELKFMPAALMRPKVPRSGCRVFLERIPFIWKRLKFLDKVTIRNLFRYKKRFFMTVLGIMGCTALTLSGFAIKNSVTELLPKQYDRIYNYDLMAVVDAEDNEEFLDMISEDTNIKDYINLEISSIKVINEEGASETVQLMVLPDQNSMDTYIQLQDTKKNLVMPDDSGVLITRNAAQILGLEVGGNVILQTLQLEQSETVVSDIVENYLGNHIYMTKEVYETLFKEYKPNGILAHFSEECTDQIAYADALLDYDMVITSMSIEAAKEDFASNFTLINAVVTVFIVLAAGLAFVVLFTLSNTNISERIRELATTKVLGFYDTEVHAYVNKETLILTAIGILVGLPMGWLLSSFLTNALEMPSIYFETYLSPISYLYAAVISFCFALIVNLITNRTLNQINMVEALKSVE